MRMPFRPPAGLHLLEQFGWLSLFLLFAAFAAYMASTALAPLLDGLYTQNDFFAQWSFAKFAHQPNAAQIYDPAALHQFQLGLRPDLRQTFPYPYPPSFLLFLWPLAWLSYAGAYAAWMGVTLLLYLVATLAGAWRSRDLLCLVLAPATVLTIVFGQSGLLYAALLVGGVRLLNSRPVLAGILFGLLTYKPQFGMLIPLALIAAGQWRCILAAAATTVLLVLLSSLMFGAASWWAWIDGLPAHAAYVDTAVSPYRKQSILANLTLLHVGRPAAQAAQAVCALAAALLVWLRFPRVSAGLRIAVLAAATFLAAPYAFLYDMPMLTNAVLAMLALRPRAGWASVDRAIAVLVLAFPAIVTLTTRFFWICGVALVLLAALVAWRTRRRADLA